jgi:uncharacterized membrane protein
VASIRPQPWDAHPAVRTGADLTFGERAADKMRMGMGSWAFIFGFLGFMAVWVALNVTAWVAHWDPYPFILLNLLLSTLAGLQGGILLIAAKRADQISSELAMHVYDNGERDFATDRAAYGLLLKLCEKLGVSTDAEVGNGQ